MLPVHFNPERDISGNNETRFKVGWVCMFLLPIIALTFRIYVPLLVYSAL